MHNVVALCFYRIGILRHCKIRMRCMMGNFLPRANGYVFESLLDVRIQPVEAISSTGYGPSADSRW